ncbi:alginate O-acetyltransferase AlgF [Deinococcus sp.]|uniref:alginate O-acetyltransferase AlgF n=1 Tax=Deinococcus sp. TaxID=47478 RepID=UPI003CC58D20
MKKLIPFLALVVFPVSTFAQQGLYEAAPPANSAFVRVLNAPTSTLADKIVTAEKGAASAYVVIPQGDFTAKVGSASSKLKVEAGKFYSVVSSAAGLTLLTDQPADNKAKALLTVYNLSKSSTLDLKTADGKTAVVSGVKQGASGSRAVNGITVDLAAFGGGKTVGTIKGVRLERGNAYALVVTDSGMTITASSTRTK